MQLVPRNCEARVRRAVAHYWKTLGAQVDQQRAGQADRGARSAVTGGKQMDGFCELVSWVVAKNGMPDASIHVRNRLELPGYFRPTKRSAGVFVVILETAARPRPRSRHPRPNRSNNPSQPRARYRALIAM
jgi:hypothetical protein